MRRFRHPKLFSRARLSTDTAIFTAILLATLGCGVKQGCYAGFTIDRDRKVTLRDYRPDEENKGVCGQRAFDVWHPERDGERIEHFNIDSTQRLVVRTHNRMSLRDRLGSVCTYETIDYRVIEAPGDKAAGSLDIRPCRADAPFHNPDRVVQVSGERRIPQLDQLSALSVLRVFRSNDEAIFAGAAYSPSGKRVLYGAWFKGKQGDLTRKMGPPADFFTDWATLPLVGKSERLAGFPLTLRLTTDSAAMRSQLGPGFAPSQVTCVNWHFRLGAQIFQTCQTDGKLEMRVLEFDPTPTDRTLAFLDPPNLILPHQR